MFIAHCYKGMLQTMVCTSNVREGGVHHCSLCIVKGMLQTMVCTPSAIPVHIHDCEIKMKAHPGPDPGPGGR